MALAPILSALFQQFHIIYFLKNLHMALFYHKHITRVHYSSQKSQWGCSLQSLHSRPREKDGGVRWQASARRASWNFGCTGLCWASSAPESHFCPKSQGDKKEPSKPHTYLSTNKSNNEDVISTKIINHINVTNLNFLSFIVLFWILYVNLFCKRARSIKIYT